MSIAFDDLILAVQTWAKAHGIEVQHRPLPPGKAAEFDGLSVTMNRDYDAEERTYYLIHALGSIVLWSLNKKAVQSMYDELRDTKGKEFRGSSRLERAIGAYRAFEIESSELAVALLNELHYSQVAPSYANFMRADLEAMTEFHRSGQAPVWRDFFARWNEEVARGSRRIEPFVPKPLPRFQPVEIERQEVLQQQG